jgi:hypothetical protein
VNIGNVARRVWQEFSPQAGEELACGEDGMVEVTVDGELEGFDIDPGLPVNVLVSHLADRIQTIVMESRQQMVPDCPLHPAAHPLESEVVDGAAAWVCPSSKRVVRFMRINR